MINLQKQAEAIASQETGFTVELVDPATGEPAGASIVVVGLDSRRSRKSRKDAMRYILAQRGDDVHGDLTDEEHREYVLRYLAGCIVSWTGITSDGNTPLECTFENALLLLEQVPWIEDACDKAIGTRANFTKG